MSPAATLLSASVEARKRGVEMRKSAILMAVAAGLLLLACGAAGPRATVEKMVTAFKAGDGSGMVSCMHPEALVELDQTVAEIKENPEESAAFLGMMGVEASAEEISALDAGSFMTLMMKSPMFAEELGSFEFTVGAERIEGETALVELTVNGEATEVKLVKYEGRWVFDPEGDFDLMDF